MNREDDLKNLWKELREISDTKEEVTEKAESEDPSPKEVVELDSLLSRLEDVVSRLEEVYGKKESKKEEEKEEKKEEEYIPRRIRRPLKGRE